MPTSLPPRATLRCLTWLGVLMAALTVTVHGATVSTAGGSGRDVPDQIRRLLTLLTAAGEDYREGIEDGRVVRPVEWAEAQSFVADARQAFDRLAPELPDAVQDVRSQLDAAAAAAEEHAPPDDLVAQLTGIRERLTQVTGVTEEIYPVQVPSAARGQALYAQNCASCHGERGDGTGAAAAGLQPPPANFTDAQFMRGETPSDFYHVISLGKRGTAMPAWDGVLSVQERWDLVSYLWTLAPGKAGLAEGQGIYLAQCASCHGVNGNGQGIFAPVLLKPAPDITEPQRLARGTDAELFAVSTNGIPASPMPSFSRTLRDEERWKAVVYMRWLSLGGPDGVSAAKPVTSATGDAAVPPAVRPVPTGSDADTNLEESARLLDAAIAAYDGGDDQASALAADAYMQFEPLEPRIGATHASLKSSVEERFLHVRQLLRTPGHQAELRSAATALHADLAAAHDALAPHANRYALFFEAVTIILREGLEIVLVVGALIAYVKAAGHVAMLRPLYAGTSLGVAASLVTAAIFGELLHVQPGAADLLEGVTMLLAAVVLFWVSYWLISKTEAARWQRYIRSKVQDALGRRRSVALAGAAFLAVYREGFETVLFYQALYASAPAATLSITAGLATGGAALALVYIGLRRFQVQIPIRQFFFCTGLFLYAMAAVFAGQGVHELQEAGIVTMQPLAWIPTMPLLGLYPSVQTVAAQGVFVALLIYATILTVRRRRHAATAEPTHFETAPVRT